MTTVKKFLKNLKSDKKYWVAIYDYPLSPSAWKVIGIF